MFKSLFKIPVFKTFTCVIVALSLVLNFSSPMAFAANDATFASSITSDDTTSNATIFAKTYTISKISGKYYYLNENGKVSKKTGWKKASNGKYTYYVGASGYVTYKITNGKLYKWSQAKWKKVSTTSSKLTIKKIGNRYIYITKKGVVARKAGWRKNKSGSYTYYVDKTGTVKYKIKSGKLFKWSGKTWKKVALSASSKKTIGDRTFTVNASGTITSSKAYSGVSSDELYEYATNIISLINAARSEEGLSEYTVNSTLMANAAVRAKELATSFSHTRPDGTSCFTAVTITNYIGLGENIAYTSSSNADYVMNLWMNSEGHRANILSEYYDSVGVAVYYNNGVYYWVQIFASTY